MGDLISREFLQTAIHNFFNGLNHAPTEEDIQAYIEAAPSVENKGEWIPVTERLPEDRQSVLVWCPQYKNIYCAYLEKEQWWIFGAFVQIVPNEVVACFHWANEPVRYSVKQKCFGGQVDFIAWMPLPEPYKADMKTETCNGCTHPCVMYEPTMKACEKKGR